ncbi:nucleotidyltransferase family protein [Candidatus Woesearchaeota archaeon]|nr:nucleotidyltransferase family protein [Candidatus Woesearchaeota archaeon]
MKAVILAAGRGTRLAPLTDTIPKALVPINGRAMLDIILEQLSFAGVTEAVIVVHYLKDKIIAAIGNERHGIKIKYAEQEKINGSAPALLCAEPHITDEKFITLACDSLFETDLLSRLLEHDSDGVFTCREVEDGRRYGILETSGRRVTRIIEKPENPPTNLANFSVYLLPHDIFDACRQVPFGKNDEKWLPDAIQNLIEQGMIFTFEKSAHILDIGTNEQLAEAQELAKKLNLANAE